MRLQRFADATIRNRAPNLATLRIVLSIAKIRRNNAHWTFLGSPFSYIVHVGKAVCPSLSLVQGYDRTVSRDSSTLEWGDGKQELLPPPQRHLPAMALISCTINQIYIYSLLDSLPRREPLPPTCVAWHADLRRRRSHVERVCG